MFQPKIPTMPQPSGLVTPPAVVQPTTITPGTPAPAPAAAPAPARPVVQLTPAPRSRSSVPVLPSSWSSAPSWSRCSWRSPSPAHRSPSARSSCAP